MTASRTEWRTEWIKLSQGGASLRAVGQRQVRVRVYDFPNLYLNLTTCA